MGWFIDWLIDKPNIKKVTDRTIENYLRSDDFKDKVAFYAMEAIDESGEDRRLSKDGYRNAFAYFLKKRWDVPLFEGREWCDEEHEFGGYEPPFSFFAAKEAALEYMRTYGES